MLVLLIMFIITIPIQTHAVKLDLPGPSSFRADPVRNEIVVTSRGAILWNGAAISDSALRAELARTQQMRPIPELHLRPDAQARYDRVDAVLAMIKREHVTHFGFVGNEAYAAVR